MNNVNLVMDGREFYQLSNIQDRIRKANCELMREQDLEILRQLKSLVDRGVLAIKTGEIQLCKDEMTGEYSLSRSLEMILSNEEYVCGLEARVKHLEGVLEMLRKTEKEAGE